MWRKWVEMLIFNLVLGILLGIVFATITIHKKPGFNIDNIEKWKRFYYLYDRWLRLKQQNKNLSTYLKRKGYCTIAIYGGRELALRLIDELQGTEIEILYLVDRNKQNCLCKGKERYLPYETLPKVDAIVVTAVYYFEEIQANLKPKVECDIVSLEDIVNSIE